jgi:hypothetical protein
MMDPPPGILPSSRRVSTRFHPGVAITSSWRYIGSVSVHSDEGRKKSVSEGQDRQRLTRLARTKSTTSA